MNETPQETPQETETLFVQTLSGHSFLVQMPKFATELSYMQLVMNIQSMGHMVCGPDIRIPWSAIAFIARGETAQNFIARVHMTQMGPPTIAGMTPQGAA
jgi:hypothetical protein